jgi:hypothetical protein
MFQNASSLKPLGQLKPNCPGMIIGRFSTSFMFLYYFFVFINLKRIFKAKFGVFSNKKINKIFHVTINLLYPSRAIFHFIVAISFFGGGNRGTQRKPMTCSKSLTNFITYICNCMEYTLP